MGEDRLQSECSCYVRRTLVGQSETKSSQGRYSQRDTTSLKQLERSEVEGQVIRSLKPNAQGLKNTLDCVEQEWGNAVQAACYLYYEMCKHRTP